MSDALSWALVQHAQCVRHGRVVFGGVRRSLNLAGLFLGCLGNFTREHRRDAVVSSQIHRLEPNPPWGGAGASGMRSALEEVVREGPHSPMANSPQPPFRHLLPLSDPLVQLPTLGP